MKNTADSATGGQRVVVVCSALQAASITTMAQDEQGGWPPALAEKLRELEAELADGDITQQGFEKKRQKLLSTYAPGPAAPSTPSAPPRGQSSQSVAEHLPMQAPHLVDTAGRRFDSGGPLEARGLDDPRAAQNRGQSEGYSPQYQPSYHHSPPPPIQHYYPPIDPYTGRPILHGQSYIPHGYPHGVPGNTPGYGHPLAYAPPGVYAPVHQGNRPPVQGYHHSPPNMPGQPGFSPQHLHTYSHQQVRRGSGSTVAAETHNSLGHPSQHHQPQHQQQQPEYHQNSAHSIHSRRSSVSGSGGVVNPSATSSPSMTPHSISREGSVTDYRLDDNGGADQMKAPSSLHSLERSSSGQPENVGWRGTIRLPPVQPLDAFPPKYLDPRLTEKYAHVPALLGKQALPTRRRVTVPPQIDKATGVNLLTFPTIASLLRFRAQKTPKQTAFTVTDHKGRDLASITYEKLNGRAEKIAQTIKDKSQLKRGDPVALLYKRSDALENIVALYGCLFAGMVAVPIVTSSIHPDDELSEILYILDNCKIALALTTEAQLKTLTREFQTQRNTSLPRTTEYWKTTDFSASTSKKHADTAVTVNSAEVACIEFTKNASGDLKGVVIDNRAILSQCLQIRAAFGLESADVFISAIENRVQSGLLATAFLGVCAGCHVILVAETAMVVPGAWMRAVSNHKATVALMGNPSLMDVLIGVATGSSKKLATSTLGTIRTILVNSPLGHSAFLSDVEKMLGQNGLPPKALTPLWCLEEFGGAPVTVGALGAHRVDVWIDAAAFKNDRVRVLAYTTADGKRHGEPPKDAIRMSDVGCILPEISLAVVDPICEALRPPNVLGEIWCNSQECLPRSFKNLAPLSEQVFKKHPLLYVKEEAAVNGALPSLGFRIEVIDGADFVRTGYLGFIVDGNTVPGVTAPRLFVAGLARDRILQRKVGAGAAEKPLGGDVGEYDAHFTTDLVATVCANVNGIQCCAIFCTTKLGENLPIVVLESNRPPNEHRGTATQVASVLLQTHGLRAYAIGVCSPGVLPRSQPRTGAGTLLQTTFYGYTNGIATICGDNATMPPPLPRGSSSKSVITAPGPDISHRKLETIDVELCTKAFLLGQLPIAHLWMNVEPDVISTLGGGENASIDPAVGKDKHVGVKQVVGGMSQIPLRDDRIGADLESFPTISHILADRASRDIPSAGHATGFSLVDHKGRETGKPMTFAKASNRIRSLANYLLAKKGLHPGDHVVLIYPLGLEYITALHACLYAGIVPIPLAVLDSTRLGEDVPNLLDALETFACKAILCFGAVEELLKSKVVAGQVKALRSTTAAGGNVSSGSLSAAGLPPIVNTANGKVAKLGKLMEIDDPNFFHASMRISGEGEATTDPAHDQSATPALILCNLSSDLVPTYTTHTHASLISQLRIQTIHASLLAVTPPAPFLACLTTHLAPHIFYAAFIGPYVGAQTVLLSPADFYAAPHIWFELVYRLKVRDIAASYQMMRHAMASMKNVEYRSFSLNHLQNLALPVTGRPETSIYRKLHQNFLANRLEDSAIGTCFSPPCNSCVSSRAYMRTEVCTLGVDRSALRVGQVRVLSVHRGENGRPRAQSPKEVHLQDCGRVVNNTVVAIVDAKGELCGPNEVGEIYVCSPAVVANAHLVPVGGLDPALLFAPTGSKGFLYPVSAPTEDGALQEAATPTAVEDPWDTLVLAGKPYELLVFVVGQKEDEMQVRVCDAVGAAEEGAGVIRSHWKEDIERTVEECWAGIGACVVHQTAPASVIIFLESPLDAAGVGGQSATALLPAGPGSSGAPPSSVANNLALVPVVVHAVLEAHEFFPATIVFTKISGLARSRTGQKMRGRVAAAWAQRKLAVITEFAVRDSAVGGCISRPPSEKSRSGSGTSTPRSRTQDDEDLGIIGVGSAGLSVVN
ncbi:hypothetical protein HDU86_004386 [Geranomyces michiganensis]|nr:hypothetical protein HDU86_004386 [Geranomyces michiganensis]